MSNIVDAAFEGDGITEKIAQLWADSVNPKETGTLSPKWRFDCGYKLDFDGGILAISCRFYPPSVHYGDTWDGKATVLLLGEEIKAQEFDCPTLEQLHKEVTQFVNDIAAQIKEKLHL